MSNSQHRRGSTYLVVLGATMLVSVFGMMAIMQQRIQRRSLEATIDIQQARCNAATAIRLGLRLIKENAGWRATYPNGTWIDNQPAKRGNYTLQGIDPYDDDLTDDSMDPIVLTGIGFKGDAVQRVELTLYAKRRSLECLTAAICCNDDLQDTSGTIRADRPIYCDQSNPSCADIHADVVADQIEGGTYHGQTQEVPDEERPVVPGVDDVLEYYLDNGTSIDINSLPTSTGNLLTNSGIENGEGDGGAADDWHDVPVPPDTKECEVEQSNDECHSGNYSLLVKNREAWNAGPVQYTEWVHMGVDYYVEAWVYHESGNSRMFQFSWYTKGTESNNRWAVAGKTSVPDETWTKVAATMRISNWSGDLEMAYLKVEDQSSGSDEDFHVDDILVRELSSGHLIYRQLLGPNHNPFGGGTNPAGIYIIDCENQTLFIERSRILGTLVLTNWKNNSAIRSGPIHWSPAVKGHPALLVTRECSDGDNFIIAATREGLREKALGVNFNPPGAPYGSLGEDTDMCDTFPSEIRGLIHINADACFQGDAVIRGTVLVNDDIDNATGSVRIEYDPNVIHHPPPGYEGEIEMTTQPGATEKAVN